MNAKPNVLTVRVPYELKQRIEGAAYEQGVSINQFALYAFTKELGELENSQYYKNYLGAKTKSQILNNFDNFMKTIPKREVPDWDSI